MANKIIISCAINRLDPYADHVGRAADHARSDRHPAIDAAKAGAAILHLHARDPRRPAVVRGVRVHAIPAAHQAGDRRGG